MNISPWIHAARLRTLPLAFSSIITGTAIAVQKNSFDFNIFFWALVTTILLQILSNYANDYGDALSGKDKDRNGEKRMVASGEITPQNMKKAIYVFSVLSFISGLTLIRYSFENYIYILLFLVIGMSAIWAAIKYTAGKNPYGYSGYGDLFVFFFFGLVGVLGTSFLYTKSFDLLNILPALSIGALSTMVLTLNNLRDVENDAKTGKNTLIVKMGYKKGKSYFAFLLLIALISMLSYAVLTHFQNRQYLFLLAYILLSSILKKVLDTTEAKKLDPFLKRTALSTFLHAFLFLCAMLFI